MIERDIGRYRLEVCPDNRHDEATLRAIIEKHVLPGTDIMTDGWKGYDFIRDQFGVQVLLHQNPPTKRVGEKSKIDVPTQQRRSVLDGGLRLEIYSKSLTEKKK